MCFNDGSFLLVQGDTETTLEHVATILPGSTSLKLIDIYGKSDPVVARTDSHLPEGMGAIREFRPGHTKWDYNYTILELQPDIIIQVSKDADETDIEILRYIQDNYVIVAENDYGFTVKKDSPFIPWDEVEVVEP